MALTRTGFVAEVADIIGRELGVISPSGATLSDRIIVWSHWGLLRIARQHDFNECMLYDTSSAVSVASQKTYSWITDWSMANVKSVYSIVLSAETESRKLVHVPVARMTELIPYPEGRAQGKSTWYIPRGTNISLIAIPDTAYALHIDCSIWPPAMANDTAEAIYTYKDDLIVSAIAVDAFLALGQDKLAGNWEARMQKKLGDCIRVERAKPDYNPKSEEFTIPQSVSKGDYIYDPFITTAP